MIEVMQGLSVFLDPWNYLICIVGVTLGITVGAIPGLTGTGAIAILLPITLQFEPVISLIFMSSIYKGSLSAGSMPAILLGIPGTPAAAATIMDGFPMAKKGQGVKAILTARFSSFIGDFIATIFLILVTAQLAKLALLFGAAEYGTLIIFTFLLISAVSSIGKDRESFFKGLIGTGIGMLVATVGTDPISGTGRFTFNVTELIDGFNISQVLIGLYALSEVFYQLFVKNNNREVRIPRAKTPEDGRVTKKDFKSILPPIISGSLLGTIIGALPGLGATIASFISYNFTKGINKKKKEEIEFGEGNIKGVAAAESANSAVGSSNLIPTLSLGIPGDAEAAILLSVLVVYGITPGPLMFEQNGPFIYMFFLFLLVANIFVLLISFPVSQFITKMVQIRTSVLIPIITGICILGVFGELKNSTDVFIMILFGLIGFGLRAIRIPLENFVIGFILTTMMEEQIRRSLIYSDGDFSIFVNRPIALFFLIASAFVLLLVFFGKYIVSTYKKWTKKDEEDSSNIDR